jgi:hypothetical protein
MATTATENETAAAPLPVPAEASAESPDAVTNPALADLPPRGRDVTLPMDARARPVPIRLIDLPGLARKTARAERRYYQKLDRHRPLAVRRIVSSIFPLIRQPVFLIGAARSGTTFLGDCVGRLPEISYHHEPPATKAAGRYVYDGSWGERRSRWFFKLVYRWLLRIELDGDLRFCEKTPTNVHLIPFLSRTFPDSQFIHIIRDGRDAAASHMNKPWLRADAAWSGEREPGGYLHGPWPKFWVEPERSEEFARVSDARRMAWAWRRYTEAGLRDGPPLGPARYHELRYESLVREPPAEAERILDFLGIRDRASRAAFVAACERADGASLGSWRSAFYPSEVADIEAEAGALLAQLGYTD